MTYDPKFIVTILSIIFLVGLSFLSFVSLYAQEGQQEEKPSLLEVLDEREDFTYWNSIFRNFYGLTEDNIYYPDDVDAPHFVWFMASDKGIEKTREDYPEIGHLLDFVRHIDTEKEEQARQTFSQYLDSPPSSDILDQEFTGIIDDVGIFQETQKTAIPETLPPNQAMLIPVDVNSSKSTPSSYLTLEVKNGILYVTDNLGQQAGVQDIIETSSNEDIYVVDRFLLSRSLLSKYEQGLSKLTEDGDSDILQREPQRSREDDDPQDFVDYGQVVTSEDSSPSSQSQSSEEQEEEVSQYWMFVSMGAIGIGVIGLGIMIGMVLYKKSNTGI